MSGLFKIIQHLSCTQDHRFLHTQKNPTTFQIIQKKNHEHDWRYLLSHPMRWLHHVQTGLEQVAQGRWLCGAELEFGDPHGHFQASRVIRDQGEEVWGVLYRGEYSSHFIPLFLKFLSFFDIFLCSSRLHTRTERMPLGHAFAWLIPRSRYWEREKLQTGMTW